MQNNNQVSYSRIIQEYKSCHTRAWGIIEKIWPNIDKILLNMLRDREWRRFYNFKVSVKWLEKNVGMDLALWILQQPNGQHLLSEFMKKLSQRSPKDQISLLLYLDKHKRWAL